MDAKNLYLVLLHVLLIGVGCLLIGYVQVRQGVDRQARFWLVAGLVITVIVTLVFILSLLNIV
jgi:hypothetical protein